MYIVVTDNFYYMQGVMRIVDDFFHIHCMSFFQSEKFQRHCRKLDGDDYVIVNFSCLNMMIEVHKIYKEQSRAKIILAPDIKLFSRVTDIDGVCFFSSDVTLTNVERFFKNTNYVIRKRMLTIMERKVMSLLIRSQTVDEISRILDVNTKTISIHKNRARNKIGLVYNNDFNMFSLMKLILSR